MGLHEAWVGNGPGGCHDADAAVGFLHYDCEDEAWVDVVGGCDREDGGFQSGNFRGRVIGDGPVVFARFLHDGGVEGEAMGPDVSGNE